MREHTRTLTPTLSLSEGEGAISMPSPPVGEREMDPNLLRVFFGSGARATF